MTTLTTLPDLLGDLDDQYDEVRALVAPLGADDRRWDLPTPADGWTVRDQVSHLAYFDDAGRSAMVEPERFAAEAAAAMAADGDPMAAHLARGRALDGDALLAWWGDAHRGMVEAFAAVDPSARVPWYGPPMGTLSFISARLMETWAHGQDVADALDGTLVPTDRLRHIAHLGVRSRPFSYAVRGLEVPAGRIDVEVTGPSGATWTWSVGEADPAAPGARITGPALDFCLVVTQRVNVADTALVVEGSTAAEWMAVAQAFAGPPGPGRPPRS